MLLHAVHVKQFLTYAYTVAALFISNAVAQVTIPEVPPEVILSEVLQSAVHTDNPCQKACNAIASRKPEVVFLGQTGSFEFWDAKQAELIPRCRVEPSSALELCWILQEIINHACHFAVKSGGHDRTPGASNADGGITIDLVKLNGIEVTTDKRSVNIGAGLRWVDVYKAVEKEQLMVLGGRIADVGVGGLLLGGGISFFSNEHGLACDSVISYEIVLPNATILHVDRESQSDLYRSLRGAGAVNFGIVTSFQLETFPIVHAGIWTGQRLVPWENLEELLQENYKMVTEAMDVDPGISIMNIFSCQPTYNVCHGVIQYQHTMHDSPQTWPNSFKQYSEIRGLEQTVLTRISPVSEVTQQLAGSSPSGKYRTIYGTFSYEPSIELERQILAIFQEEADLMRDIIGFVPSMIMHPFSKTMISKMRKNGGNALHSVATRKLPLIIMNVSWEWAEKMDDERAHTAYYRLMARMETVAKYLGVWHPYKYINYAETSQEVFEGYGHESLNKLTKLQRNVDPLGIFARGGLAGGSFKLHTADEDAKGSTHSTLPLWDKSEL